MGSTPWVADVGRYMHARWLAMTLGTHLPSAAVASGRSRERLTYRAVEVDVTRSDRGSGWFCEKEN